jgi:predicted DNA-binding protein
MSDLVNDTAKSQLSQRNSEPSHIAGKAPYTEIGGKGVTDDSNGTKINATAGVNTDTTIPKAVPGEASHLDVVNNSVASKANADTDVDISYDDEITESDDIDKQLDQFEAVEPVEIDIVKDDEKKEAGTEKKSEKLKEDKPNFFDKFKKDDDDTDDKKVVKEDGEIAAGDAKERGDNNSKMAATFGPAKAAVDSGPNKELPEDANPFAKKDDKDDKDKLKTESTKPRLQIKMPSATTAALFESAGVPAKAQKKMALIFEAAIKDVTKQVSDQLNAHHMKLHEARTSAYRDALTKQVGSYLDYVVEEWVATNKVAIRQSLRSQVAESFMDGLKSLFNEHNVEVPQSKVDVLEQLSSEVKGLKAALNEQQTKMLRLHKLAESANKARIVSDFALSARLSEEQTNKLKKLAESVTYTSAKEFREKVSMLKEHMSQTVVNQALKDRWEAVINDPNAPVIKESWKKKVTAILLENTATELSGVPKFETGFDGSAYLKEDAPVNSASGFPEQQHQPQGLRPDFISLVRRSMPNLIAYDVCGVQPMTGPTGLIFALKSRYVTGRKRSAVLRS